MHLIAGLHGTVATILICALLFIDEAGVPLPFAPNEGLLIFAGFLISTGGLAPVAPVIFVPLAILAMSGGLVTAYAWARALGPVGLRRAAVRLHAVKPYDRATARLRDTGPAGIFVARMLPGVRIYSTLVCGASEMPRRRFLLGAIPAVVAWCLFFTGLGLVVGIPAERAITRLQRLALQGGLLLVLGIAGYLAARLVPSVEDDDPTPLRHVPTVARAVLALALDLGIVACLLAGLDALTRFLIHAPRPDGWKDVSVVITLVVIAYVVAARRGPGATVGERLLDVTYRKVPLRLRRGDARATDGEETARDRADPQATSGSAGPGDV